MKVEEDKFGIFDSAIFVSPLPLQTLITNGSSVIFRNPSDKVPQTIFENKQASDIFLWTYLVNGNSFAFVNKKLNYFRRHSDSTTTKISANSQKSVYKEYIKYLNFFKQEKKFQLVLNHYIKHYVWNNKTEVFDYTFLKDINNVNSVDKKYFTALVKFCIKKIYGK